jgi:zinc transport system permease protein
MRVVKNRMTEFIESLRTQIFMQNAILMGVLASFACGIVGTYVVVKKIGYISGGIAHAVLGGMGIAYFLGKNPIHGAIIASIIAAIIIGLVNLRARQKEDTIIGAIWAIGMAIGIIFISLTPGYNADLMSYLFGNILYISRADLIMITVLDLIVIAFVILFFRQFMAVSFDEEYAKIQGMKVEFIYLLMLCLIAVTVVIMIQVVGLILVIALLTLPAAIAGHYSRTLSGMMVLATILGIIFTTSGLWVSYDNNLPTGATIIIIAGVVFLLSNILKSMIGKHRSSRHQSQQS